MKTLILVRHAKSSWDDPSLPDFERPLNERGKKDAPEMAKRLIDKKIEIDAFVSSPAKRAKKTCKAFAKEYKFDEEDIVFKEDLYEADTENFLEVIKDFKNKWDTVALFSHNPGITYFANSLTETKVDNMPTCSVFVVKIYTDKWESIEEAGKEFSFFDFPKAGLD